jgi:hypothetical protein
MQRNGDKKLYFAGKTASLQRCICQEPQNGIKLGLAILETKYHCLQAVTIDSTSGNGVKTYFTTLTIRTRALEQGEFAGVAAATPAVVGPGARQEPVPAILAQIVVGFADAFSAVNANSRPEKLVKAVPCKGTKLPDRGTTPFLVSQIHG